ncbi:hypothetical protein LJC13_02905, partial [Peptostreptococcaceae bacterium OttesenSCG-928-C18]|nr:hypothetical protein [Peptostreptococcaceae bacterium OttesenSCG-928-C18]
YNENPDLLNKKLVHVIEKGKFLCGYHVGIHEDVRLTAHKIRKEGEKRKLKLKDYFVTTNIIDQFIESNREKYITEIQIPLEDK